jgi:hypothetical protein
MKLEKYKSWSRFLWGVIVAAVMIGVLRRGSDLVGTIKRKRQQYGV